MYYYNKNKTPVDALKDVFSKLFIVIVFFFLMCIPTM